LPGLTRFYVFNNLVAIATKRIQEYEKKMGSNVRRTISNLLLLKKTYLASTRQKGFEEIV